MAVFNGHIQIDPHWQKYITDTAKDLLKFNDNRIVRRSLVRIYGNYINSTTVPHRSGRLRDSIKFTDSSIRWTAPYAHYQNTGFVYGPNFPSLNGWNSPAGKGTKYKTNRRLGVVRDPMIVTFDKRKRYGGPYRRTFEFGYTDPRTRWRWVDKFWDEPEKRNANITATWYLKNCVEKGIYEWLKGAWK